MKCSGKESFLSPLREGWLREEDGYPNAIKHFFPVRLLVKRVETSGKSLLAWKRRSQLEWDHIWWYVVALARSRGSGFHFGNERYTSCSGGEGKRWVLMLVGCRAAWRHEWGVEGVAMHWDCCPIPLHLPYTSMGIISLLLSFPCGLVQVTVHPQVSWFPQFGSDCSHFFTPNSMW